MDSRADRNTVAISKLQYTNEPLVNVHHEVMSIKLASMVCFCWREIQITVHTEYLSFQTTSNASTMQTEWMKGWWLWICLHGYL